MRNLILLEQDYKELKDDIRELKNKIDDCEIKLGLSSASFDEIIKSPTRQNTSDIILNKYVSYKIKLNLKQQKLDQIHNTINFYYELYKHSNNEDEMIYIEKKVKNYSNAKISVLHGGITKTSINNKVNLVYKKYSNLLKLEVEEQNLLNEATKIVINELRAK